MQNEEEGHTVEELEKQKKDITAKFNKSEENAIQNAKKRKRDYQRQMDEIDQQIERKRQRPPASNNQELPSVNQESINSLTILQQINQQLTAMNQKIDQNQVNLNINF